MLSLPYRLDAGPAHTFDTTPRPIDQVIAEMLGTGRNARISRADALSVAAVQRGRNELCAIATLPLRLYRGLDVVPSPLLRQIDPDVANVITLAATVEDLIFEGISWWQVTGQDFDGYPVSARHVDVDKVSLRPPAGKQDPTHTPAGYTSPGKPSGPYVWVDGEPVSAALMIRFDSPNPGLLRANARAIRRALLLDQLAAMFAENPQLREYFTDGDSAEVDPMSDDEIDAFIAEYMAKRRLRPVGWIPSNVKRADVNTPSPVDLQLVQLQQQVTLEIALGIGVDPEDLGVRTTSRTYFNGVDRRQEKVNRTYGPYMKAITDRLSMGDVTRRGYETRFDLTDYLKSDPLTQAQYWEALQRMGAIDSNEIRALAGFSGPAPKTAPAPAAAVENSRAPLQLGDITPDRRAIGHRFDGETMTFAVRDFAAVATEAPKVDAESRTITGLALPYNAVAQKYGIKYRFKPGSLEYDPANLSHLKHLQNHGSPVGVHLAVDDTKAGPVVKLSVLDGIEGSPEKMQRDQLLYDAANGLYDGLSVGVEFSLYPDDGDVVFSEEDGVYDVVRATWRETSSTPLPAFTGARVTKVAASLQGGNEMDPCQHCGQRHNPGIACATFAAQLRTAPTTAPAGQPAPAGPAGTATEPAPDALAAFTAA
ncbi:MAG TPA: phage portal protein, partial [Pseudonocardia sp.]